MSIVRNNHDGHLTVAGVSIRPGSSVDLPKWSPEVASAAEQAFLDLKKIEVVDPPKAEEEPSKAPKPKA